MIFISSFKGCFTSKKYGWLEMGFAIYPIISAYRYGGVPLYLLWLLVLDFFALRKRKIKFDSQYQYFRWLYVFVLVHECIWLFVVGDKISTQINILIGEMVVLTSFFIIIPVINYEKMIAPFCILSFVCILGLLYHVRLVLSGQMITQIPIPFLPTPDESRLLEEGIRPKSFFNEPQAYCSFMLVPLYITLVGKKYLCSIAILLSMLLSTSTTGMITGFLMLFVYSFAMKISYKTRILVIVLGLFLIFILLNNELFEVALHQAKNKDLSDNERTSVGLMIISQLDLTDILFGIPYISVGHMYDSGLLHGDFMLLGSPGNTVIFVPSFWGILFKFGIAGLGLYILLYFDLFKRCKEIWPFAFVMVATLFSNPDGLGGMFLFNITFAYAVVKYVNKNGLCVLKK